MKSRQEIVLKAKIHGTSEFNRFSNAWISSELFSRLVLSKTATITRDGELYDVTLYIKADYHDLVEKTFKRGNLRHWRTHFKIK